MPRLNQVIRLIAQRDGFLGRKGDGEPGAKTLWLGLQEIAIFVEGARYAREPAQNLGKPEPTEGWRASETRTQCVK